MTERETIQRALNESDGKIGLAARRVGLSRRVFQTRMRRAGFAPRRGGRPKRRIALKHHRVALGLAAAAALAVGVVIARKK